MARRAIPWRAEPPDRVKMRIEDAKSARMYLVQTNGPTAYVVRSEGNPKTFRVLIGEYQTCSCNTKDTCVHILFIMIKVLRVSPENPLVWQRSLLDSEIRSILAGQHTAAPTFAPKTKSDDPPSTTSNDQSNRKRLDPGDVCPICQDDMTADEVLTWCRLGCGNNVHNKCMHVWADHRKSIGENVSCPLCRCDWGSDAADMLRRERAEVKRPNNVHFSTSCSSCKCSPIYGYCYRCITCIDRNLCARCFNRGRHGRHTFVKRSRAGDAWTPAQRQSSGACPTSRLVPHKILFELQVDTLVH